MSITNIPNSKNSLQNISFKFSLSRAPNLNWTIQGIALPGITVSTSVVPTPFSNIPTPGGKITFNPLRVTFRVQENLADYLELHNWLIALGHPVDFQKYKALSDVTKNAPGGKQTLTSDISLSILNSSLTPNINIKFFDAFPTELSDLEFNLQEDTIQYIQASADFTFLRYEIQT